MISNMKNNSKASNKTPNQMHQSIVTFIAYSHRRRSACFEHHRAHHQELFQTAVAAWKLQFKRAPDDGQDGARNMLSGVYVNKQ
jgi:hypothetical protein